MIGAGVFSAWGPATDAAGTGVLIGLVVAAAVAFCNATSSAQLAAVHPESGGTYVYARRQLGPLWGYLAGWGFVVGKTRLVRRHRAHRRRLPVARPRQARRRRSGRSRGDRQRRRVDPHRPRHEGAARRGARGARLGRHRRLVEPDHLARTDHPARHLPGRCPARRRVPVLRLRRLRPHRHPRRGGPRSQHHDPQGDPARSGGRAGRLRRRRRHRARRRLGRRHRWPATHRSASSSARRHSTGSRPSSASAPASPRSESSSTSSRACPAPCSRWPAATSSRIWFATIDDRRSLPLRAEAAVAAVVIVLTATLDLRGAIGFSGVTILTYYAITNAACLTLPREPTPMAGFARRRRPRRVRRPRRDAAHRRPRRRQRRARRGHHRPRHVHRGTPSNRPRAVSRQPFPHAPSVRLTSSSSTTALC